MKILALDSSGLVASVAVVSDDNLIGEYSMTGIVHRASHRLCDGEGACNGTG